MSKVEELVAALHEEGALDSEGSFTLDSERAREKLRQYQLARPHEYVLLLVQAAVLRGATKIRFDIDADDVRMNFDGAPFTREDFADLYSAMFVERASRAVQARQELALAVNAAMALNPRYIRVFSGDTTSRVFLELRPSRPDKLDEVKPIVEGTWIHVKQRFRPGLLVQFLRNLRGTIVEELALRERCRYADVEILLDGVRISHGPALPGLVAEARVEGEGVKGVCGLLPPDGDEAPPRARVDILCNGVMLTSHELPELPSRVRAVVDGSHLKKDVSQFDVVKDEVYARMMDAVRAAARRSIAALLERHAGAEAPVWEQALARECLLLWSAEWSGAPEDALASPSLAAVCGIPLWSTTTGARMTTRALLERDGDVEFSRKRFGGFIPEDTELALHLPDDDDLPVLTRLLGERLKDATRKIERAHKHEKNRLEWRARTHPPHLGDGSYVASAPIVDDGVGGMVGLRALGSQGCEVRMIKDGCLLYSVTPRFGVPGIVAVLVADFQPNSAYDGAHRNKAMAQALHALLRAVERMIASLAKGVLDRELPLDDLNTPTRGLLRNFIVHVVHDRYARDFFEQFGFSSAVATRHLAALDRGYVPDWQLEGEAHPLAQLPLFRSASAGYLSLVELAALAAQGDGVRWVESLPSAELEGVPPTLVELSKDEREALKRLLGRKALRDFSVELARLGARAWFFQRPESALTLTSQTLTSIEFEVGAVRGLLGVRSDVTGESSRDASVVVHKHHRRIGEHQFRVGLRGIVGVVNDDDAPIDNAWQQLEAGGERLGLEDAVQAALPLLVARARELFQNPSGARRARVADVLVQAPLIVYGGTALLRVHRELRALGEDEGDREFATLLDALRGCSQKQLVAAVDAARAGGAAPRAEAVLAALERVGGKRRGDPLATLRAGLVPELTALLRLELARTTAGAPVSLGALLISRHVYYVLEDSPDIFYDGDERQIVRLGPALRAALRELLGGDALEDSMGWLYAWAQRQAFERRPPLEALKVDDDDAIVTVEIDEDGRRGQLGLRRWGIDAGGATTLRVCTKQRVVCALQLELDLPMVGVIDVDGLEVSEDFTGVSDGARAELKRLCESRVEELLAALALRWAALNLNGVREATRWVIHALVVRARGAGGSRRKLSTPALKALAGVPAFPGIAALPGVSGERYSLLDLYELHRERKQLPYVRPGFTEPAPGFPVVEAEPWLLDALAALFPKLEDYRETREREQAVEQRKLEAPALAAAPPEAALFSVAVKDKGLSGHLWVEPDMSYEPVIELGDEGKVIERRTLKEGYPCRGAIKVPVIRVSETWDKVNLARKQESALRRAMNRLYRELVAAYEQALEPGGEGTIAERVRAAFGPAVTPAALNRVLQPLLLRLHRVRGERKSSERTLYRKLRALPLLALGNGRLISLEVALDERPNQLEHLGLWFVAPPEWKQKLAEKTDAAEAAPEPAPEPPAEPKPKKRKKSRKKIEIKALQPTPEPLPAPTAEQVLLDAVRGELRLVRGRDHALLSNAHLDAIDIDRREGAPLVYVDHAVFHINLLHPVAAQALRDHEDDPLLVSVLASAVYTALNLFFEQIEDDHEAAFHALHAQHVLSATAARPPSRARSGEIS
ncbi:MAG: hypothetical protein H6713_41330 [Myxococcales bacterium]|nr:hypothetical protein [Myxococcales bacterium]